MPQTESGWALPVSFQIILRPMAPFQLNWDLPHVSVTPRSTRCFPGSLCCFLEKRDPLCFRGLNPRRLPGSLS